MTIQETFAKRTAKTGAFNTTDGKLAKSLLGKPGVQHVFSCDLGGGKTTHRFMVLRSCGKIEDDEE